MQCGLEPEEGQLCADHAMEWRGKENAAVGFYSNRTRLALAIRGIASRSSIEIRREFAKNAKIRKEELITPVHAYSYYMYIDEKNE